MNIKEFATYITRLINKENLSREEAHAAFSIILRNETTDIQQGAFLAALSSKGETKNEIAGCWQAIYENDTVKVTPKVETAIVENSGTGMDSFKTFNISTCASLVAVAGGVTMARHGARALTSMCGTIDIAEALGVDVEGGVEIAAKSLEENGMALFNGMSPKVHPMALGRILSQMSFGSTLNIAASLASPVIADYAVRGVYSGEMIKPIIDVMQAIGYKRALVFNGQIDGMTQSMDELSVAGISHIAELTNDGVIKEYTIRPEDAGIPIQSTADLQPLDSIGSEAKRIVGILKGDIVNASSFAVAMNAGAIFYVNGDVQSLKDGTDRALEILKSGKAIETLRSWVKVQNSDPDSGTEKLNELLAG